jgi:hypothetical protein
MSKVNERRSRPAATGLCLTIRTWDESKTFGLFRVVRDSPGTHTWPASTSWYVERPRGLSPTLEP